MFIYMNWDMFEIDLGIWFLAQLSQNRIQKAQNILIGKVL